MSDPVPAPERAPGRGRSLRQVLADGAARVRVERGLREDAAAELLCEHGLLNWTDGTVRQVEAGVRPLSLEELLLLCAAYGVSPAELAGDVSGWVELAAAARIDAAPLRALLSGRRITGGPGGGTRDGSGGAPGGGPAGGLDVPATRVARRPGTPSPPDALVRAAARFGVVGEAEVGRALAGIGDAERNAARRLGVSPERLVFAAVGRWGQPFAAERDARIEARRPLTDPALHLTLRGVVTRELLVELEAVLLLPGEPAVPAEP
jgi:transcriptional regulator with XRE-family HTH domain